MAAKILMPLLGLILVMAVACGSAAEPTVAPADEPAANPIEGATAQPTAAPQPVTPPTDVEANPGVLTIMVGDFAIERFDNSYMSGKPGSANYLRVMGGYLISDNEEREMVPGIAEKWELSDDGLTWTFTIREGVKFHDGSDITAEDSRWTLEHYYGPQAVEYATSQVVPPLAESVGMSGQDVHFTTTQPLVALAYLLAEAGDDNNPILPGRSELHNVEEELAYDQDPIGAGPMELVDHVPASSMTFERFEDFYYQPANGFPEDKRVSFESLKLHLVPEESTRVATLRAGDADIVPASLPTRGQVEAGGGRLVFAPEGVYIQVKLLGCYEEQYPCHDQRVRQALDYAIDRTLIQNQLYGGPEVFDTKGWTVVTPSTIGYTPELDPQPFDPEKARQLLADAGYPDGEGFGALLINTSAATSMPFLVESAQLAAEFWRRELGIDAQVVVGDRSAMSQMAREGELNGQVLWRDNEARRDAATSLDSSYVLPDSLTRLHEDPEIFELLERNFALLDPDERARDSEQLYLRLKEESYELSIGYANIPWGVGPRVKTWDPYPLAIYPSGLHTITIE